MLLATAALGALGWLWLAPSGIRNSPDISLTGIDGEELHLADYRGRPLLVMFWATTCETCIREMPHLIELYRELAPRGLEVIGITMDYDPPNLVLAMREHRKIPYPIALDIHAEAARAFGDVRLTPTTFLIAPDGSIVYRKVGAMDIDALRADILGLLPDTTPGGSCNGQRQEGTPCSG